MHPVFYIFLHRIYNTSVGYVVVSSCDTTSSVICVTIFRTLPQFELILLVTDGLWNSTDEFRYNDRKYNILSFMYNKLHMQYIFLAT